MRRKKLAAGEIRFRVSKDDLKRLDYLMSYHEHDSISALLRSLINNEYRKRVNDGAEEKSR